MAAPKGFAALILTHGRPHSTITVNSLRRGGYTGPVVLVLDDQDPTIDEYRANFEGVEGVEIEVFDKEAEARRADLFMLTDERRSITFARNASFGIAQRLGYATFVQLDDDYTNFRYRSADHRRKSETGRKVRNLDGVFAAYLEFLERTGARTVAMWQGGDFGSRRDRYLLRLKRKVMNSFFCRADRPVAFLGLMNEDVNTYVTAAVRGERMFTAGIVQLDQGMTQSQDGGITEMYLRFGTYSKAFSTVMAQPSCVRVAPMGSGHQRLHHRITWEMAAPKILHERYSRTTRSRMGGRS